jgi:4-O-beta-D-mannosyl-D-glucose phosphorylase
VATSTVEKLLDYAMNTAPDGYRSIKSVEQIHSIVDKNLKLKK